MLRAVFDNPQTNAYFGPAFHPGVDNYQFDLNANTFDYRANSLGRARQPRPPVMGKRPQIVAGKTDYYIGLSEAVSWLIIHDITRLRNLYCGTIAEGAGISTEPPCPN